MRFTTKTEYGLFCLIYMAKSAELTPVSVKEIVKGERYSQAYIEKILQKLRSAKIVASQQGKQGGFILTKRPSEITLKEIIEALEGQTFEVFCEPDVRQEIVCTHFPLCGVKPIWERTKNLLDNFYESITLEMIAKNDFSKVDITMKSGNRNNGVAS